MSVVCVTPDRSDQDGEEVGAAELWQHGIECCTDYGVSHIWNE